MKDNNDLKDIVREYTESESDMINEYMQGKVLVKIKDVPHAYSYKKK